MGNHNTRTRQPATARIRTGGGRTSAVLLFTLVNLDVHLIADFIVTDLFIELHDLLVKKENHFEAVWSLV